MKYHSIEDVAHMIGVGKRKVRQWVEEGHLTAIDVANPGAERRQWRISEDAIREFDLGRSNQPQDEQAGNLPLVEEIV